MKRQLIVSGIFGILFLIVFGASAIANDQLVDTQAMEIYNSVMSPYCPGVTLSACTSPEAGKLRLEVRSWLADGMSSADVREMLTSIYGQEVRGVPKNTGFGLVGWLMPAVAIILGLFVIRAFLKRTIVTSRPQVDGTILDAAMEQRIKEELRKRINEG